METKKSQQEAANKACVNNMKSHILKLKIGVYKIFKIGSRLIIGKIHSTIYFS
jgi:hypothetical protein